jgi:hypothetical protein
MDAHPLAYELISRRLDRIARRAPSPCGVVLPDTVGTGVRLFAECAVVLFPAWLVTWSCLSWGRMGIVSGAGRAGTVLYYWPEILLILGALPPLFHGTLCARDGREIDLRRRLWHHLRPFVRVLVGYALAVAVTFLLVDADLRDIRDGYWSTHGLALAVTLPLLLASFYAQFAVTAEEVTPLYAGYRCLGASQVEEVALAACDQHIRSFRSEEDDL